MQVMLIGLIVTWVAPLFTQEGEGILHAAEIISQAMASQKRSPLQEALETVGGITAVAPLFVKPGTCTNKVEYAWLVAAVTACSGVAVSVLHFCEKGCAQTSLWKRLTTCDDTLIVKARDLYQLNGLVWQAKGYGYIITPREPVAGETIAVDELKVPVSLIAKMVVQTGGGIVSTLQPGSLQYFIISATL